MKRVGYWLFSFASVVSLGLFAGCVVFGVRGFFVADNLQYISPTSRLILLKSKNGRLDVLYLPVWKTASPGFSRWTGSPAAYGGTDYSRRVLGFGAGKQRDGRYVNVPDWFLALVFALLPAAWILRQRRLRRRQLALGLCPTCGYDLRATPNRCPECGSTPPTVKEVET